MLCCSCGMCFSAALSSVKAQGSMNLASKTAVSSSTTPSRVAPIHSRRGSRMKRWTPPKRRLALEPAPVQILRGAAELDEEVAGQVLWLDLAALLFPQPNERILVRSEDNPCVRAADIRSPTHWIESLARECHSCLLP